MRRPHKPCEIKAWRRVETMRRAFEELAEAMHAGRPVPQGRGAGRIVRPLAGWGLYERIEDEGDEG